MEQRVKTVQESATLDPSDPQIKQDILRMILQYLQDEGYSTSFLTVQDEANVKLAEQQGQRSQLKRARKAILEGDWNEVEKLCRRWTEDGSKISPSQQKSFLYSIYREQYLELIEGQEYQKAFTHLTKRLKPLEASAASEAEFRDLCYLLTCKSVQEVLRDWEGVAAAREKLAQQVSDVFDASESQLATGVRLPERRLVGMLQQAVAFQIEHSHYQPTGAKPQVWGQRLGGRRWRPRGWPPRSLLLAPSTPPCSPPAASPPAASARLVRARAHRPPHLVRWTVPMSI